MTDSFKPLVDYPDSDSESDSSLPSGSKSGASSDQASCSNSAKLQSPIKPQQLSPPPPPPKEFLNLFNSNPKFSKNSHLYEGKFRAVPHIQGSWPSHIYIQWTPNPLQLAALDSVFSYLSCSFSSISSDFRIKTDDRNSSGNSNNKPIINSLIRSEFNVPQPLHISLSTTLMIPSSDLHSFKKDIGDTVRSFYSSHSFSKIQFQGDFVYIFPNDDNSRFFLVLALAEPCHSQVC